MKKLFSLILTFSIVANIFSILSYASYDEMSFDEFYKQFRNMVNNFTSTDISSQEQPDTMRLIVKTKTNIQLSDYYDAVSVVEGYGGLHFLQFLNDAQTDYAFKKLLLDNVEYVEKDFYLELGNTESSTTINSQEHFSWNSATVQVDEAFELIENSGIALSDTLVAVIDTGIYSKHKDFIYSPRIIDSGFIFSQKEVNENGEDEIVEYSSMTDSGYHGTHVSGIIFDNSLDNIYISPYKVTCEERVLYSDICLAVERTITFEHENGLKVNVINISIAGGRSDQNYKLLYETIDKAINIGIIVVVSSGNYSMLTDEIYPACNKNAITVSASKENNTPWYNSNYGKAVDISAPGYQICSTVPKKINNSDESEPIDGTGTYDYDTGTSMAAPLVSAAAAMIKSIEPDITPAEVERIIKETAFVPDDWEESCGGKNYGTGIVNFYNIARAMLGESESQTPEIEITPDNKFKITTPEGSDSRIYYTLDGTVPTIENHLTYTEPLSLRNTYAQKLTVVCHENGKLIGDSVSYDMITNKSENLFYRYSDNLSDGAKFKNAYWSSYNPDIVSVDKDGSISANSVGTTKITCRLQTGEQIVWNIKVRYTPLQSFFVLFFFGFLWL